MDDLFITKKISAIESLKSEALYKMADIFRYGADECGKPGQAADLIILLYFLAEKMGCSYHETDADIISRLKAGIKTGEGERKEELSLLLRHFEDSL